MLKVLTVVGARPQFIKAAAVSREIARRDDTQEILVHTGQHYDANMSQIFFDELGIPSPDINLSVGSGPHGEMTGKMLAAIERVLLDVRPDWVLVYGDTNSTLAGALAAAKQHFPVAHVEAGLRSFNRRMPEEINRVLTDHAADLLLAPTEIAVGHLRDEGIPPGRIRWVGDVMFDVALHYGPRADQSDILKTLQVQPRKYILASIHRAENTDDEQRMRAIFAAFGRISAEVPVVLPLHPRTRGTLERLGLLAEAQRSLKIIEPVGYLDMLALERSARLIATDSGGVQKEAFFCGVPCLTLREETEWQELVDLGVNRLVTPLTEARLEQMLRAALAAPALPGTPPLYGDGHAAAAIIDALGSASPQEAAACLARA
ncbi:MAG: non-hydrolyzing UDP-N-acetylglucosamine 2-epimerase [Pirellulales bacterium]